MQQKWADAGSNEFLRGMRAVRRYDSRPVEQAVLDEILEVARWTGSGKNSQPWELVTVQHPATKVQLADCGTFAAHLARASVAVVLVMENADRRFDEGRLAQNLMLAAWGYGVGSCMATFSTDADVQRAKDLLRIPVHRFVRNSIALGYPADEASLRLSQSQDLPPGVVPLGRKPVSSMVHREQYRR
jgi:nitroreductase